MSLRRPSKDQPDNFEFNSSSLEDANNIISKYPKGKQQSAEFSGNKLKKSPVALAELIKADFGAIICFGLDVVPEVFRTISFESSIQFRINSPKCVSFTLSLKIRFSAKTFKESIE